MVFVPDQSGAPSIGSEIVLCLPALSLFLECYVGHQVTKQHLSDCTEYKEKQRKWICNEERLENRKPYCLGKKAQLMGEIRCNISKNGTTLPIVIGMSIPTFLLGLTFNAMTLWAFCCKFRKWTETIIYVTNLAVSDSMLLLSLPFKMYSYKSREELGSSFCAFIECLYFVNMYVSMYIIVCISMDRCIAIKYPLKAKSFRSPMKAAIACGVIWTFVCLVAISLQIRFAADNVNAKFCFLKQTDEPTETWIIIIIELLGFIIPFFILSFCSLQIIMALCKKSTESQGNVVFSRSITIIATNLIIFIICFLPFHAGLLIQFLVETFKMDCVILINARMFVTVSTCLANVNCCLDGIIYYFASKEVRASLTQHIRRISRREKLSLDVIEVQNTQETQQSDYL